MTPLYPQIPGYNANYIQIIKRALTLLVWHPKNIIPKRNNYPRRYIPEGGIHLKQELMGGAGCRLVRSGVLELSTSGSSSSVTKCKTPGSTATISAIASD
jgi:hypothetical protein